MKPYILAIESSCDDTSAAVWANGKILANLVASQKIHEEYGGVVPELASRAHLQNIIPVVDAAMRKAGISKRDLDAVAVTRGPGLIGSLMVGCSFAKSLSQALGIPLISVHHMQAHIAAHYLSDHPPGFPFLNLTVSGGHTQLVLVKDFLEFELLGETLDDAAGEAFDKIAKMLGLPYPGGPVLDRLAQNGNPLRFSFPESKVGDMEFSFSGLKTAVLYFLRDHQKLDADFVDKNMADICASVQHNIVQVLLRKMLVAASKYMLKELAIAGGVSANSYLRKEFVAQTQALGMKAHIPPFEYCTDNAAMIAMVAAIKYKSGDFSDLEFEPVPTVSMSNLL